MLDPEFSVMDAYFRIHDLYSIACNMARQIKEWEIQKKITFEGLEAAIDVIRKSGESLYWLREIAGEYLINGEKVYKSKNPIDEKQYEFELLQ